MLCDNCGEVPASHMLRNQMQMLLLCRGCVQELQATAFVLTCLCREKGKDVSFRWDESELEAS